MRGVRPDSRWKREGVYLYRLAGAKVVCAGMGSERAMVAVRVALEEGSLSMLVSAGLAGGCDPALASGAVIEAGTVVDARSGERFVASGGASLAAGGGLATLVTTHTIAGVSEKQRLFQSYGAAVVDMEAATVARLAQAHGLRFRAIKAVSDAHDFELTSLARFQSRHGHFRTGAFALHTALRPASWRKTVQLGAGSQRALRALTAALERLIEEER